MKLQIPGQLKTGNKKVMLVLIRIRKEFEIHISKIESKIIDKISPIFRVGGIVGSFGDDLIEDTHLEGNIAVCDVVVAPREWDKMTDDEIYKILKTKVIESIYKLCELDSDLNIHQIQNLINDIKPNKKNPE